MTKTECQIETIKHIEKVRELALAFIRELTDRVIQHDKPKLESPEIEIFSKYTPKLSNTTYGSEEYKRCLQEMKRALDHHYKCCRHHPEHFQNGINDMTLVDIVEMFCDWKASTLRHNDGNFIQSIDINADRFNISPQLKQIFINTAKMYDNETVKEEQAE